MVGVMEGKVDDVFEARFSTCGADGGLEVIGFGVVVVVGGGVAAVGLWTAEHGGGGGGGEDGAEEQQGKEWWKGMTY